MAKVTMAKKTFRLSPNEEAAIIKKEKERRRKLRLQQVREQEKAFAQKLRKHAKDKREQEVKILAENLQKNWVNDQINTEKGLERLYEKSLNNVGEGHRAADEQETEERQEMKFAIALQNEKVAIERHNNALKELQLTKNEQFQKENAHLLARKNALEVERARAAAIASLPPPPEDPLEKLVKEEATPPVKLTSADGFSTTLYHLPSGYVEKAEPHEQGDAKKAAEEEEERMKEEAAEMAREAKECQEKAILRHKHAKEKVDLEQDFNQLMVDLGHLEQVDRRRRQKVLNRIPYKVFQPPHRRMEERADVQQDMEQAFEDMYMAKTDYSGDLTLALEPKAPGTDPALDLTADSEQLEKIMTPIGSPKKADFPVGLDKDVTEDLPGALGESKKGESSDADPKRESLRKLMTKIKTQREEWVQKSMQESVEVAVDRRPDDVMPTGDRHTDAEKPEREEDAWAERVSRPQDQPPPPPPTADSHLPPMVPQPQPIGTTPPSVPDEPILAGSSTTLLHPYEQASLIRSKQMIELEQRQEEQRRLMEIQEQQRRQLEDEIRKDQLAQQELRLMLEENRRKILESKERLTSQLAAQPLSSSQSDALRRSAESEQKRLIREHQQKLLQQQRLGRQGITEAKARLQSSRNALMQRYPDIRLPTEPEQSGLDQHPYMSGYFPPPMPPPMGYIPPPPQYPTLQPQPGFFQPPAASLYQTPSSAPSQLPQVPVLPPRGVPAEVVPSQLPHPRQTPDASVEPEKLKPDGYEPPVDTQAPDTAEDDLAAEHDISLSTHGVRSQGIHAKRQEQLAKQKEFLEKQREDLLRQQAEQQRKMSERQQQLQQEINRQQLELQQAQRASRESDDAKAVKSKAVRGPPPVQRLPPSESVHPHELSTIDEADISRDSEGRPASRQDIEPGTAPEQPATAARAGVPSFAQDVGRGVLSYPSYTRAPSSSKDTGSTDLIVKTDGRFTFSSFQPPLFPRAPQDDSVSSGSIVSDSITSGEIEATPLYPSSSAKATALSGQLPPHREESEENRRFPREPLGRDLSLGDSKPLDPIFFQRSKAFSSDSDTSPENGKFFPLPKSSGSTNESESQEKRGAAVTTASTVAVGTKLKDRMLKSMPTLSSSDEETGTKSRFDSLIRSSDRSDESDGSFRPLPEALSDYSLSTHGHPSPLKTLMSLERQTLDSTASSSPQKSLTYSPSKRRPIYTASSLGDTLSEHSLPTQDSYRFSPSKSRTGDTTLSDVRSLEWRGRSSDPSRSRLESGFGSFKWKDALKGESTFSPEPSTSLVKESSPPGRFRGTLSMSPMKDREDFKPPQASPSTPEHEETKFTEFASPAKSKGRDDKVQSRIAGSQKDSAQSGEIIIEKPTAVWEYVSSDDDIEDLRGNASQVSSLPLASDASVLSQQLLTETEGSISSYAVKDSPLPAYMQLHSPIKPSLDALEPVRQSPMKEGGYLQRSQRIPGNVNEYAEGHRGDLTEAPVIFSGVSDVQGLESSDAESQEGGAAVTRYDRLIEESRRLREKHKRQEEDEKRRLDMLSIRYQEMKEALEQPVAPEEEMRDEDDSQESGILEEPDLTLVSIETSSIASGEDVAESLVSFEQHENLLAGESLMMKECRDYDTISSGTIGDSPVSVGTSESGTIIPFGVPNTKDSENVSLQEAFLRKKQAFIEASKKREEEAKVKAKQKSHEVEIKGLKKTTKISGQDDKQESYDASSEGKKKSVTFSPAPEILSKPHVSPVKKTIKAAMKTKNSADRKQDEQEMKQRNLRLYSQLEEVKERKVIAERKESYASNREKAKEFQKKTLEMLKKKSTKVKK